MRQLAISGGFVLLSLPSLLIPLGVYGLARCCRQLKRCQEDFSDAKKIILTPFSPDQAVVATSRCLLVGLMLHSCFVFRYGVVDQHTFLLPWYTVLCISGGLGWAVAEQLRHRGRRRTILGIGLVLLLTTPLVSLAAPSLARRCSVLERMARHKPYRDDYRYLLWPWSVAERSAEQMASEAVRLAEPDGLIIVEDRMGVFAVQYKIVRAGRDRIQVVTEASAAQITAAATAGRPVVLVPAHTGDPQTAAPTGQWDGRGDLYVLGD